MAEANELITWLGFKFKPDAKKNIEDAQKSIEMIKNGVKKMAAVFLGASGAISYFTNDVMKGAQEMSDLSKKLGMSTDDLQKWKYVADASGQSFEGLIGDLQNFKKVGIDAVSLSGRLAGMGTMTALQWKDRLGLSDDMFNVLRQGPEKVKKLMSEAYVIPGKSIEQTAQFNKQLNATKNTLVAMKNEIFMAVSPTLVDLTNKFKDWMQQNKEFIKSKLVDVIKGVALGFQRFVDIGGKTVDVLIKIAKWCHLIGENTPEVESIAKIVTGVLMLWAGGKIVSGLATVFTFLKGIWGILAAIGKSKAFGYLIVLTKGFVKLLTKIPGLLGKIPSLLRGALAPVAKILGPILVIFDTIMSWFKFWKNGVSGTLEDWKENWHWWDWINPVKLTGVGAGWLGEQGAELFDKLTMKKTPQIRPTNQSQTNTTTNQNSGNTIYLQMPYEQAVNFTKDVTGGQAMMSVIPGGFGPNM